MIHSGLVSVSFRQMPPERVAELAAQAQLDSIEWGGDIHVPVGDLAAARRVAALTRDAGLFVSAYGSYYRAGTYADPEGESDRTLESALELGAPLIRIWAGNLSSAEADEAWREKVNGQIGMLCRKAAKHGVGVAAEYHGNTLTDAPQSIARLLRDVPELLSYWQPPVGLSVEQNLLGIASVSPRLANVHVFHWTVRERRPLEEGASLWSGYLAAIAKTGGERVASLEFFRNDSEEQMLLDAQVLRRLLGERKGKR